MISVNQEAWTVDDGLEDEIRMDQERLLKLPRYS